MEIQEIVISEAKGKFPDFLKKGNDKDADDKPGAKKSDKMKNDKDADDKKPAKKGKKK